MPRKPIEWSKCIIYKIWKDDDFYVGSTTDFTNRKRCHKSCCNNENVKEYNFKLYQTIREKGGWDLWQMIPLEEYTECQTPIQARIREEEWRIKLKAQLNTKKCFGAEIKEYYQEHKEELNAKHSQYYQEHKEQISEKNIRWYQKHKEELNAKCDCECGGKYSNQYKSRHEKTKKHQNYLATLI